MVHKILHIYLMSLADPWEIYGIRRNADFAGKNKPKILNILLISSDTLRDKRIYCIHERKGQSNKKLKELSEEFHILGE